MSFDWGPHFIVPSDSMKSFSGIIRLREDFDEDLLHKELEALGISGAVLKVSNPWYYRRKNTGTWVKIGESEDREENFPVKWDTSDLENGHYEVLGLMHVFVKAQDAHHIIAGQNIVEVNIEN